MPILDRLASGLMPARVAQAMASRDAFRVRPMSERRSETDGRMASELDLHRLCGVAGCTSAWAKPWKSRRRPVFEDDWACSGGCLETLVRAAIRREIGDATELPVYREAHRHRVPLGLVLLAQGWITHPQLQAALASQRATGEGRVGDWLVEHCGLPEERVTRGLGVQWSCPVLSMDGFSPRAMALVMPKRFISEFGMVPVRVAGSSLLYVAFQERLNAAVALSLEQMCGLKVESGLLTTTQLEAARASILSEEAVPVRIQLVPDADALSASIVKLVRQGQPVASRLVRVQQYYWLRIWLEEDALPGRDGISSSAQDTEDHIFMVAS